MIHLKNSSLFVQKSLIHGAWCDAQNQEVLTVYNPATGENIGSIPNLGEEEIDLAIQSSYQAFLEWSTYSVKQRCDILERWYNLIIQEQKDLAHILTIEQGKPIREARGEIVYGASFIKWFIEQARRHDGDIIPSSDSNKRILVIRQAVGVCAAITPWNFPNAMITRKLAPALSAGCTMIIKPALQTPFSALALGVLAQRAGIPAGVINIITGSAEAIGKKLTSHPLVKKISFTGSTQVGRLLMRQCSDQIKKISLELGGHAPFIVFEDADLDAAVEGAIVSKFRNAGQTCICANRLYIHRSVYTQFAEKFYARVKQLKIGNGLEEESSIGPIIDQKALTKVSEHVKDALAHGATLMTGGHIVNERFYAPSILLNVTHEMRITQEETFGPIAPLIVFDEENQVIEMANDTEYGLAAYVYTQNLSRSWRVSEKLEYGMVGINTGSISCVEAPFGGIKQSGIGREGSQYGMNEYTELKYICVSLD